MPSFLSIRSLLPRRRRRHFHSIGIQATPQSDEPLQFSRSDLGEVVPEATESEAEIAIILDAIQTHEPLSELIPELLKAVSVARKNKAVRLLAARIPPELFDNILFYVNADREARSSNDSLKRCRGERSTEDILADLKRCSLICLFWANKCREHIFSGRALQINSYEDAAIFRRYFVEGCPKLTPVHQLIRHVNITQNYSGILAPQDSERQTSFLHLLYLPTIQDKLASINIVGPVSEGFSHAKLDTPHWGIPPCIVVPSSFLKEQIRIRNIHLPSFYHVTKYIRHFVCADKIYLEAITWSGQTPYTLPHVSSTITCRRRPRSLKIMCMGGCTDAVHLALTALMMNPNCPLHRLSDEERVWMIDFMALLWGAKKNFNVWIIGFDVSEQTTTMNLGPFSFVFGETLSTDRSSSAVSVVGMHTYIYNSDFFPANFDALANHARTHPTIRALVLLFDSLDDLQVSVKPFVGVLTPATETIEILLAYEEKERKAVGVDLATLEPSGRVDTWTDEQSEVYWGGDLSLQMLQRQLKKKRW